ncbi:hypothetical protein BKE38_09055 [Pseudoroseomonas deserti]|uniref:Uncharacterized protein n=1 Tax=Teichococcus deserti TaxID=1817963 RepID=A0A1V2H6A6_9PROT|nr:hypothetical protein [Pseudoroseomonas deserti]ONG55529.1 hypothetical protein BKE38_09055 [Pseudoroseomonas deserti]
MLQTAHRLAAGLLAATLLSAAAMAAPLSDMASGLSVNPPAGYIASVLPPTAPQTARFQLKRAEDRDTGCQVAFTPAPQNAQLSQPQINQMLATPAWQEIARKTLSSTIYEVISSERFDQGDLTGFVMVADFKVDPRLPPRSRDIRSFFVIIETPKGRTSTVCVGEKASFGARQAEFAAVARGATPPR